MGEVFPESRALEQLREAVRRGQAEAQAMTAEDRQRMLEEARRDCTLYWLKRRLTHG